MQATLNALRDKALPVQMSAAKAMRYLIEVEGTEKLVLPQIELLLNE